LRIGTQRPAVEELSERAVGDAETNIHGLELFVSERPDATSRFNWGQRCEERVDRARVLRRAGLGRCRGSILSSSPASTAGESAATAAESAATATKSATTPKPSTTATKFAATAAKFATAAAAKFTAAAAAAAHLTGLLFACAATLVR
jgi:hypothetical protein